MTDGALLLDKAVGVSSNRALQEAKKLLGARKAGHAGTLDPLASGLLIVLLGEATKFAGPQLDADKEYLATLKLGEATSTGDAEGEVLSRTEVAVDRGQFEVVLERFRGPIRQMPPMHSALKHRGVPLYRLARRGEVVARLPREVVIHQLALERFEPPYADLRVRCSKGTYVRTLGEDIGAQLGCGAHLTALRRTAAGGFRVEDAVTLEALAAWTPEERARRVLPLRALLAGLPSADVRADEEARLRMGQVLQVEGLAAGLYAMYGPGGHVVGLGEAGPDGRLRPLRLTQAAEKHQ